MAFYWTAKALVTKQGRARDASIVLDNAKLSIVPVFGAIITIVETATQKEVCKYKYKFVECENSIKLAWIKV